ncbi:hypothetical protein LCGC14_2691120 [marine sediment metagenome]|uniref:Uncharacterized protein n=1 Tax=marine sediment metagenome TaxID=412755 RepID=A0A0F9CA95_9ZZZZ
MIVDRYCIRCGTLFEVWQYVETTDNSGSEGSLYCLACEAHEIADAVVREPIYQIEVDAT